METGDDDKIQGLRYTAFVGMCKRDAKDLKNENDWHPVTEEEARQMELSFQ